MLVAAAWPEAERAEALAVALADPLDALICWRALPTEQRPLVVGAKDESAEGEMKIDPTKTTKEFTVTFDKKFFPEPIQGIYEHKGDKFKAGIGTAENPVARPKSFDAAVLVLVFTEEKPKK